MKKSRFSEEQIAYALQMADGGTPVVDVCRQIGISEATFYTWKKKYGELGVSELRKLRQLEDENARLLRIVADLTLDKQILQEVVKKSSEGCQAPRAGSLDAGAFQAQRAPLVPTGAAAALDLVRQERGTGPECAAPAHPGHRAEPAGVWLPEGVGDAPTRILTGIDPCRRESVCLEANFRLSGRCVAQALDDWAYRRGIKLDYTRPGKPKDNGLIESFNGRLRDEFLNVNEFVTLHDAREKLKAWQDDYNHHRPHSSLGNLTPSEFVNSRSVQPNEAASL
jgi:transposase-like protein